MPDEITFAPNLDLLPIDWNENFKYYLDQSEFDGATNKFSNKEERIAVLNTPEYKLMEQVQGTFYGIMLKQMLEGDSTFVMQKGIVAIVFDWYVVDNQLRWNPIGMDEGGGPQSGKPTPPVANKLYIALKGSDLTVAEGKFSEKEIKDLLGFTGTQPSSKFLLFYPVIITMPSVGGPYFALATRLSNPPDPKKPYAYGPPCPPVCYG